VHLVAKRYIAGPALVDAMRVVRVLNAEGAMGTVDILGEDITERTAAEAAARAYVDVLEAIRRERLDSNISVKLSALGLRIDPELCHALMRTVVGAAREHGAFVRIDMEDSSVTSVTLEMYKRLRREFANVGVVLQACLRRTLADARELAQIKANVRLCKGIYREPRAIAYQDREIVRRNYAAILETLLRAGSYVGIATHDELLVWEGLRLVQQLGLTREEYEFQMLLGVEDELRHILVAGGHRLRVYIPFGAQWYGYSMRRLKENPQVAGYVFKAMLASAFGKRPAPAGRAAPVVRPAASAEREREPQPTVR
jgi:proline dehydrogenase